MNPIIDLTENHDFSKSRVLVFDGMIQNIFTGRTEFPWNFREHKDYHPNELVLTGDREERNWKRKGKEYMDGDYCECCGKDFKIRPWEKTKSRLCANCEDHIEERVSNKGRYPWLMIETDDRREAV